MGAEDETIKEIYSGRPQSFYIQRPDQNALEWVLKDIADNTPWFFYAEWFDRIAEAGYITYRRAEPGEVLQHRHSTRVANGGEVVAEMTEKGREWYRAWQVAEKLRGAA